MARIRTHEEIIRDILTSISEEPILISQVMQRANLTSSQVSSYLDELQAGGFALNKSESSRNYYRITPKGQQYLQAVKDVVGQLPKHRVKSKMSSDKTIKCSCMLAVLAGAMTLG